MSQPAKPVANKCRFTATVDDELYEHITYWAKKKGITINELLRDALNLYVRHANKDYDIPEIEIQRLNQLIDTISTLSSNVQSLESVTVSGFDSLLELTRGDNYLLDPVDGDIDTDDADAE